MDMGVAVIPAKGNSEGVPYKNLQTVGGRTLLSRTIDQAREAECIDQIFVVTEDEEVMREATRCQASIFPCTPLMSDNSTMVWEKVRLVAESFKDCRGGIEPVFVELHPTYPFRTSALIDRSVRMFRSSNDIDGVLVASPLYDRVWKCGGDGWVRATPEIKIQVRQNQVPLYLDHYGLCNVFSCKLALNGNPYNGKLGLCICDEKRQVIDIDEEEDLRMCHAIASRMTTKLFPGMGL